MTDDELIGKMFDEVIETQIASDGTVELKGKKSKAEEPEMTDIDTDVHYENKKAVYLTLCGKPTPPAKTSPYEKNVTCLTCRGQSALKAIPDRPDYPNPARSRPNRKRR
jgi:hypothetical protein